MLPDYENDVLNARDLTVYHTGIRHSNIEGLYTRDTLVMENNSQCRDKAHHAILLVKASILIPTDIRVIVRYIK